jgi:outer membrane protein
MSNVQTKKEMKNTLTILLICLFPAWLSAQDTISLDRCRMFAIEHNQKMRLAKSQVEAADALKKAASTQYLPNFSINGTYTYINKDYQLLKNDLFLPVVPYSAIDATTGQLSQTALNNPTVAASTFVFNPSTGQMVTDASGNPLFQKYTYLPASKSKLALDNIYLINGGFTQPLFMGGKIREANRIATITREIAEHQLLLTQDEIIFSVEETYWRVVSLREKVRLAEQYGTMLRRLVSDLENIHSEGIITNNDLLKAKLKLSEADLQLLKAKNGMELSKMALCQMTGLIYSSSLKLTDSLNTNDLNVRAYNIGKEEIAGRQEMKILENNVMIAKSGEKIMLSRYLPNLVMNASYTFMNPNLYKGLTKDFGSDYNIGVALNIPIFHFGEKRETLRAARSEREAAEIKLDETRELLVLQLQQAVYRYNESAAKTGYAVQALEQSDQNLKYTEDNFHEGILKTTDLLEAQLLWQKAFSELIDAQTEQQMSLSNLKKVTGKY